MKRVITEELKQSKILAYITALKKLCNHPKVWSVHNRDFWRHSKPLLLVPLIQSVANALIYSSNEVCMHASCTSCYHVFLIPRNIQDNSDPKCSPYFSLAFSANDKLLPVLGHAHLVAYIWHYKKWESWNIRIWGLYAFFSHRDVLREVSLFIWLSLIVALLNLKYRALSRIYF